MANFLDLTGLKKTLSLIKGNIDSLTSTKMNKFTPGTGLELKDGVMNVTLDTSISKTVTTLPTKPATGDENKIHFVPSGKTGTNDTYAEYVWLASSNKWEKIGDFVPSVDLSNYVKKSGDTMTGTLSINKPTGGTFPVMTMHVDHETYGDAVVHIGNGLNNDLVIRRRSESEALPGLTYSDVDLRFNKERILWDNHKLWHDGNDGPGSGLDADTLDGKHDGDLTAIALSTKFIKSEDLNSLPGTFAFAGSGLVEGAIEVSSNDWNGIQIGGSTQKFQFLANGVNKLYFRIADNGTEESGSLSNSWESWKPIAFLSSNVASATKLQTARNLTIGNTAKSFNGTANVAWTLDEIGAAAKSHTHSYLPLTGGILTGNIYVRKANSGLSIRNYTNSIDEATYPYENNALTIGVGNDTFRIHTKAKDRDNLEVYLDILDNGNEPIYVRQIIKSSEEPYEEIAVAHQIALMNASGNQVFNEVTATKFAKSGGTASQFLKADGSVDNNSYALSTDLLNHKEDKDKKHIPSGGHEKLILTWKSDGEALWEDLNSMFTGMEEILAYGVEWDITVADPHLTRIGNMSLHKTLPILSQLRGCIALRDKVIYWLNDDDWRFRKDPIIKDTSLKNNVESADVDDASGIAVGQYVRVNGHIGKILVIENNTLNIEWEENLETISEDLTTATKIEIGSRLDGYDGTVRVYCPSFYIKSESIGNKCRVWISTVKIDNTWTYLNEILIDAYRSTILRSVPENMGYLSTLPINSAISVVNTSSYCRGGNNNSTNDIYLETEPFKTLLNKPATYLSRSLMRTYSRNAGSEILSYDLYKNIFYWLYVIEYANFNSLEAFNEDLTNDGYYQGGLGAGCTNLTYEYWSYYNSVYPLTPCGYCNELGNNTGIKSIVFPSLNVLSLKTTSINSYTRNTYSKSLNGVLQTKNVWDGTLSGGVITITRVNSNTLAGISTDRRVLSGSTIYKVEGLLEGLSIIFYKSSSTIATASLDCNITVDWGEDNTSRSIKASFIGDCNIKISIVEASQISYTLDGKTTNIPRWRGFDNPFGDIYTNLDGIIIDPNARESNTSYVYTCLDNTKYSDSLNENYKKVGELIHKDGYIKLFDLGDQAHIIPKSIGGNSTLYKCDYTYSGIINSSLRTLLVGGSAAFGSPAGLGCFASYYSVSASGSYVGFRSVSVFVSSLEN